MADRIPKCNAHNYAARSYIDAWVDVTEHKYWDKANTLRLKALFADR